MINIGLFVKAKINLQNAVDAAAYSGASVQARQLTKIAYLNWEMRNVHKEWMFKYYVLGNVSLEGVQSPSGDVMDFRMKPDLINASLTDPYNWPSVCIHLAIGGPGGTTNICSRYSVPGLPEFGGYSMPGAEEASRAFLDALADAKLRDCNFRTKMNLYVTNSWAFNVVTSNPDDQLTSYGPAILADRQGAWPSAVELALRIRNLEYVINREPVQDGICRGGTELTGCSRQISEFEGEQKLGNERIVKAFYSAYRNLATAGDELKETFTLRELSPRDYDAGNQYSASYLFVPSSNLFKKPFLDLKVMSVNYATFYDTFIAAAKNTTSATCDVTKLALPVPGYPLGFYKNPDVMTYYAVKGEAEFLGMFNPFGKAVKLTAYAAAKPFGGRIGPQLFHADGEKILSRTTANNYRSAPYIAGIKMDSIPDKQNNNQPLGPNRYTPGAPLPLSSFWLQNPGEPVGFTGTGSSGGDLKFGIPNLVYDFPRNKNSYSSLANSIYQIIANDDDSIKPIGLYNPNQFKRFQENLPASATNLGPEDMKEAVLRARAPTEYDSFNYLIPSPQDINNNLQIDSFGIVAVPSEQLSTGDKIYRQNIYAPLYSTEQRDTLFRSSDDVVRVLEAYMQAQKPAIDKYREALNDAAKAVYGMKDKATAQANKEPYLKAARGISDVGFLTQTENIASIDSKTAVPKTCTSMLGQFLAFYLGPDGVEDPAGCPKSLKLLLQDYFNASGTNQRYSPDFHAMEYVWKKSFMDEKQIFTAYMPGPMTGIANSGQYVSPFGGVGELMKRNSYSTKFVTLSSLRASGHYGPSTFPTVSEGQNASSGQEHDQKAFTNALDDSGTPSQVNH